MAKLRLNNEWKMWAAIAVVFLLLVAYLYFASRPPMEGGEYLWMVDEIIDARTLHARGSGTTMKIRIIGIVVPESEVPTAKGFLEEKLQDQWVRLKPLRDEPKDTKVGFVSISGEDMTARMIRQGLAKVDLEESAIDVRPYLELEQEAKRRQTGLWKKSGREAK